MMKFLARILFASLMLTGCMVGPDYKKPEADVPLQFKGDKNWKVAAPRDDVPKGEWWTVFGDPKLNELEQQAFEANQNLKAAVARVMQARAAAGITGSEQFPSVNFDPSAIRSRAYPTRTTGNTFSLPLDLGYEIDIWGRVRRSVEAADANFQASAADYETVRLTLQADVARTWFQIRALDSEISIVERTIGLRQESLGLVESRFKNGYTSQLDLEQAKTEMESTRAELAALRRSREEMVNSLAVLTGKAASDFSMPSMPLDVKAPAIGAGIPSELLERRPDVARAERNMAAANAEIGVAKAAFFPTVTLTGSMGYQGSSTGNLLKWDSRIWSLGPGISLPIFEGGRNKAGLEKAKAAYDEAVAVYRQAVLTAFQEAENGLMGVHFLKEQADAQNRAVQSAKKAESLSETRYKAGIVSYMEVVDTQRTALQAERSAVQILGNRLTTAVQLVKALGGGWK